MEARALHEEAQQVTHTYVTGVRSAQWENPTPCPDWNVRAVVNHLVSGNLWVRELSLGRTIDQVGTSLDGDLLGSDPVNAHAEAVAAAVDGFAAGDAMERLWPLSYGERPGRVYARQRFIDVLLHGWDIARATGQDPRLPERLVQACLTLVDRVEVRAAWGFASVEVPDSAGAQERLLALAGRAS